LSQSRRVFLQQASAFALLGAAGASSAQQGMSMPSHLSSSDPRPHPLAKPMLHSRDLAPWVDELSLPQRINPGRSALRIAMRETYAKVHRDVPETRLWVYADASSAASAANAPAIEARSHHPLKIEWINELPAQHFLPIDHSLHGCGRDVPDVRTVVHLHGGRTPSKDDGYPTDWYPTGHSRTSVYPLQQDATALWYHDHAMGLNRLNTYAGLVGQVLVRDAEEDALHLPSGPYELPLTIYDRDFSTDGQLFYPVSGDPDHPWVPEFYADAILVNAKIKPYVPVEPRLYRLRLLNAANSQFFSLALSTGQPLHVIGSDQGLLAAPAPLKKLLISPAERADVLIDLSQYGGQTVYLQAGSTEILQFRVSPAITGASSTSRIPAKLRTIARTPESQAVLTRTITLNEVDDHIKNPMVMLLNRKHWHEPVTEQPKLNTTEIWEFVNLTEDTHPMHLHMVRFQVLDRRVFEPFSFEVLKKTKYLSAALPPDPQELGWKDVVQCPPSMITRIIISFDGYAGDYLYHCHVLEHEANDMMRPFKVIA
jgi:spore coat protein A